MHPAVRIVEDERRGCGWRKPGGLYLCGDHPARECGRMPIPLDVCPCCGSAEISKPSRGWTWVDADRLLANAPECRAPKRQCNTCALGSAAFGRAGLLWVGEVYYGTVRDFEAEAKRMGISRRIPALPRGFVIGETCVLLAHRKAIMEPLEMGKPPAFHPGIFRIWKPERVEAIVTGEESDEEVTDMLKRGLSPVKIVRREPVQDPLRKAQSSMGPEDTEK